MGRPAKNRKANPAYKTWTSERRYEGAARKIVFEGWSQYDASIEFTISRSRLNQYLRKPSGQYHQGEELTVRETLERELAEIRLADSVSKQARSPLALSEQRRVGTRTEFINRYFGNQICPDCGIHHEDPPHHVQIDDALADPEARRLVIAMPPYHGKSDRVTVKNTVYDIVRDPNSRTLIISKSHKFAQTFLHSINELLTNRDFYGDGPNLIDQWGPFKAEGANSIWSAQQIYVAGRQSMEKDPTVQVLGVGGQVYGRRADKIKADDVATVENQKNPERVDGMISWFDKEVASRIGANGQLAWVGTRVYPGDIYSQLVKRNGYRVLEFPCIIDEQSEQVLWGDHFSYGAAVVRRAEMSPADWQLVYQQVSMPGTMASFTQEAVEACFDTSRVIGQHDPRWRIIVGLDPAGGGMKSGYTAGIVYGIDLETGQRHIIDILREKMLRAPQLKQWIFDIADAYSPYAFRVEANGVQSQLVQYNDEIINRLAQRGIRVEPHVTNSNKWDPEFGVESMAPLYNTQQITLPWGNQATRQRLQPLVDELIGFPLYPTTDTVMAHWFAELGAREHLRRAHMPMFDNRRVPNRVAKRRVVINTRTQEVVPVTLDQQQGRIPSGLVVPEFSRRLTGRIGRRLRSTL